MLAKNLQFGQKPKDPTLTSPKNQPKQNQKQIQNNRSPKSTWSKLNPK